MESKNNKVIHNFISLSEKQEIIDFVNQLKYNHIYDNKHIDKVASNLVGKTFMFDISKTEISNYLSKFQSSNNQLDIKLPDIFYRLLDRISLSLNISKSHVFLQIINMNKGGKVIPHYDSSIDGYINYKCNISVLSNDYQLYVDSDVMNIKELDMYSFESSLYKHWTNEFNSRRILLSYGLAIKYSEMNRDVNDYRVRLSKRIEKNFQRK